MGFGRAEVGDMAGLASGVTFRGVWFLPVREGEPPMGFPREAVGPVNCLENRWIVASVRLNREEATVSNSQKKV